MKTIIPKFPSGGLPQTIDGFTISKTTGNNSGFASVFDQNSSTYWETSKVGAGSQIIVTFPKPYNICGFRVSTPSWYRRLTKYKIYIMHSGETSYNTCVYESETITESFDTTVLLGTICTDVISVALECLGTTVSSSSVYAGRAAISDFEIYDADELCLLKSNNQYYSIREDYYNGVSYTPLTGAIDIPTQGFGIEELCTEMTVNGETFRPVDKFKSFSIVKLTDIGIKVLGCKTKSELLLPVDNIDLTVADTINYFKLTHNLANNGDIRIMLSVDKGMTWNTYNEGLKCLTPIDVEIPSLKYSNMTDEQKEKWENAKSIIQLKGITPEVFNAADWTNVLKEYEKVKFAYVIRKKEYEDVAELDELNWQFDATGFMRKMKNEEFGVYMEGNNIVVTPLVDTKVLWSHIMI